MDSPGEFIGGCIIGAFFGCIFGVFINYDNMQSLRKEAIKNDFAEYSPDSGEWHWKTNIKKNEPEKK